MAEKYTTIKLNKNNSIYTIHLNRPKVYNAMNELMLQELLQALNDIADENKCRALILTGMDQKAFCAGADLKERIELSLDETRKRLQLNSDVTLQLENMPMAVIAAINGIALGGGLELALSCDIRIASENALLGLPECSLGVIPGAGGTQRLAKIVGLAKAKELIFTSAKITAKQSLNIGLISHIYSCDNLLKEANKIADKILKNAPLSIICAKNAINDGFDKNLSDGMQIEKEQYEHVLLSQDRIEGLKAFAQKRLPEFTGQ